MIKNVKVVELDTMIAILNDFLKKRFLNTYNFSNLDINQFILLLQKGVYPYEYIVDRKKYNQTLLPEKEDFYSHLHIKDIADADWVCENFKMKN